MNDETEKTGSRRLHTDEAGAMHIDAAYVRERVEPIAGNDDLSNYIR